MNRTHYLVWRRGFAPVLFILATALIFVSIGTAVYFGTKKPTPVAITQPEVTSDQTAVVATSTNPAIAPLSSVEVVKPTTAVTPSKTTPTVKTTAYFNCGSAASAAKCLAEHVQTCSPAKGTVVDPASGLEVERIIDGYKGNNCSYRSNILSGTGSLAMLTGMDINCMIPKTTLAKTIQGGSMTQEDMLTLCTGTFIDLIRQQMEASQ